MEAKITWKNNMQFIALSGSGHSLTIDGAEEVGGNNNGMRPMEMFLLSLASCSAMDIIFILNKAKQKIASCVIEIKGTRSETIPKVFTDIQLIYIISGTNISENKVKNAISLSAEKYCSATNMIKKNCSINHTYKIITI